MVHTWLPLLLVRPRFCCLPTCCHHCATRFPVVGFDCGNRGCHGSHMTQNPTAVLHPQAWVAWCRDTGRCLCIPPYLLPSPMLSTRANNLSSLGRIVWVPRRVAPIDWTWSPWCVSLNGVHVVPQSGNNVGYGELAHLLDGAGCSQDVQRMFTLMYYALKAQETWWSPIPLVFFGVTVCGAL